MFALQTGVVRTAITEFLDGVGAALPDLFAGLVFLALAAVVVKLVMAVVRWTLGRALPGQSPVYRQFVATVVLVFLWFGVALSFLSIVGLEVIAASLGTATGFLALGVSYALSGMIADAVAGVYLLRDPDFMPGDTVDVGGTVGEVRAIELRKTRLDVEGDTVVRANAEIEKKWTKVGESRVDPGDPAPSD
jgi:small-conductance mechanosensitive channel